MSEMRPGCDKGLALKRKDQGGGEEDAKESELSKTTKNYLLWHYRQAENQMERPEFGQEV